MEFHGRAPNAPNYTVRWHFDVYLLWLFGWVMLCGSRGDSVDKHLIWYTQELANVELEEIQQYA